MLYCDTSVIVAALTDEPSSMAVRGWLAGCDPQRLAISGWTGVEFASAASIKLRTGQIDTTGRARLLEAWSDLIASRFLLVPIEPRDFMRAKALLDADSGTLRGGDALHLAIAAGRRATLATLDQRFGAAAEQAGVDVAVLA